MTPAGEVRLIERAREVLAEPAGDALDPCQWADRCGTLEFLAGELAGALEERRKKGCQ